MRPLMPIREENEEAAFTGCQKQGKPENPDYSADFFGSALLVDRFYQSFFSIRMPLFPTRIMDMPTK